MNIVQAILAEKKKFIILISGYLWWDTIKNISNALADNLNFEIIYINQLLPENLLITSADHLNFPVANELIKEKLSNDRINGEQKGYIIVSYSFPPEKLDFYPDIHINISPNQMLLTSLIVDLAKSKNISRFDIDNHISYLTKSWKSNKITKNIILYQDYLIKINDIYAILFNTIMDIIMKKLYGEKYDDYISDGKIKKLDDVKENKNYLNVADSSKVSQKDITLINTGVVNGEVANDLDDVVIDSNYVDVVLDNNIFDHKTTEEKLILSNDDIDDSVNNSIQSNESIIATGGGNNSFYIGKRYI